MRSDTVRRVAAPNSRTGSGTGIVLLMAKLLRAGGSALSTGLDRVTPARVYLVFVITGLIVAHGFAPDAFAVDGVTVGLLGVLVVVILVPLLSSATLPGGGGLKFREELDTLQIESQRAEKDQLESSTAHSHGTPSVPGYPPGTRSDEDNAASVLRNEDSIDSTVDEILSEAARSPRVGLMLLSAELERAVRRVLLTSGWGDRSTAANLRLGVARLVEVGVLTASAASALTLFSKVRNEIVHGVRAASDEEVLRAVDAAIPLLRAVTAIPNERHTVAFVPVPIYSDPAATAEIPGAKGLILIATSPGTALTSRQIFPTTQEHYVVGRDVTWEWGPAQWGKTWYRDPATDEVLQAWSGSMEFIGRHLD